MGASLPRTAIIGHAKATTLGTFNLLTMYSIRWKLIAVFLLVVFIPIYLIQRYAIDFFEHYTRTALEKEMVSYAFIAGEQYRTMILSVADGEKAGANLIFEVKMLKYLIQRVYMLLVMVTCGETH